MANLGLKVADVVKKFYDVQEVDSIKGMYEVRNLGDGEGDLLWYIFSSNNATYHSSGNDCVIRDINQSNSKYIDRLKAAFEKAKNEDKKIFWLVLVYGEGIGLVPADLEWMASIELKVDLDSITASLSMRTYPIGKGKSGAWEPCCKRADQDKYFNATFISCKDTEGNFTSEYMDPYFNIFDNRPYHDVITVQDEEPVSAVDYKEQFRAWLRAKTKVDKDGNTVLMFSHERSSNDLVTALNTVKVNVDGEEILLFTCEPMQPLLDLYEEYKKEDFKETVETSTEERRPRALELYIEFRNSLDSDDATNVVSKDLVYQTGITSEFARNRIVFGAPGTGKSFGVNKDREKLLAEDKDTNYERVTFHPDYSYANFVGTYKPVPCIDSDGKDAITYEYVPGPFMRTLVKALKSAREGENKPYLLIIEEINRANVAAVFGDVFQLLDRAGNGVSEYPIQTSEDIKGYLAKANVLGGNRTSYSQLRIPDNMYIWATMNSADQGVFPMDTAFKRRWDFTYIGIDDNDDDIQGKTVVLGKSVKHRVEWNKLRKAINNFLAKQKINEDKQLGPYFIAKDIVVPTEGTEINAERFIATFKNKVIMYLFEDAAKQKQASLFEGCFNNSRRYSEICKEFDEKGIGIFCADIQNEAAPVDISLGNGDSAE